MKKSKRLANSKTKNETGFDYVLSCLDIFSPFGNQTLKEIRPFFPGEEVFLQNELNKLESIVSLVSSNKRIIETLCESFMETNDIKKTIERSRDYNLSVVEIYEVKSLLLIMRKIFNIIDTLGDTIKQNFALEDTEELLNVLDPEGNRLNTFYIYDSFSEELKSLRAEKKNNEVLIRREQKNKRDVLQKEYGVNLTPKFDIVISKTHSDVSLLNTISDLYLADEDYISFTYKLKLPDSVSGYANLIDEINLKIEDEEIAVRKKLSLQIAKHIDTLLYNCQKIGKLDFAIAKAKYAILHNCTKPEISADHVISFIDGRHLKVEDLLIKRRKQYLPVSIHLEKGVTCITGANMGGKTISLKLVGLVALLAQYAFFVPCQSATIGLSTFTQMLIGDTQSMERGLSSFGSEMEELKDILDKSTPKSLLLIDEISSGTNPIEGLALTKSIVDYLKKRDYITLITTHYQAVTKTSEIKNMQVRGLADADFRKLDSEISRANRKSRIDIISKYMDYSLYQVDDENEVPKDAINIAKILGINDEIISSAKSYMQ